MVLLVSYYHSKTNSQNPNVLLISVDDLRPELNCYGKTQIISPNIDKLASDGMVFKNAYCNVPVCGASRASLLSGLYPTVCDLAHLDKAPHLDGKSFIPILKNPKVEIQNCIFSRWQNGESKKNQKYLYTMYRDKDGQQEAQMLYDHTNDVSENVNLAENLEYTKIVEELKLKLHEHMKRR